MREPSEGGDRLRLPSNGALIRAATQIADDPRCLKDVWIGACVHTNTHVFRNARTSSRFFDNVGFS